MLTITRLTVEHLETGCVTDEKSPRFSYAVSSSREGASIREAVLSVNGWQWKGTEQIAIAYAGQALKPFTVYTASLTVTDDAGETATKEVSFETGRLDTPWEGRWISDAAYSFTEKGISPKPMLFRKALALKKPVKEAKVYATALGMYEIALDGEKLGDRYFAPGFTSYQHQLQYQVYDVTAQVKDGAVLEATVAGGWAVGSFIFTRANRFDGDRQAFLAEVRVTYADGSTEVIPTDESWDVTEEGPVRMADIYDGETYDATVDTAKIAWRKAAFEKLRIDPQIICDYSAPVRAHEVMKPISVKQVGGVHVYDFGQNFAGVIRMTVKGKKGQVITVKHAEILNADGSLNVSFLRTAKAAATYTCKDGVQTYSPRLTYMGFRYVSVEGIDPKDIEIEALALYSDVKQTGSFSCSNDMINQLQSNITWGAKSNFVDIPTDCPQRDERMGWTGDIAVFSPTACWNFDMGRFLEKWLKDVRSEQLKTGGLPNTVPVQSYGFPTTMPRMAVAFWGDACVLVPWAEYLAGGDRNLLRTMYPSMKKYVKACKFWANLLSFGKNRYIWSVPAMLTFGDWVAPDVPQMAQWQKRGKWTGTASLCNTSAIVAKVARILGENEDAAYYEELSRKTADAYVSVLTDGKGHVNEEFQTAYVLPLHFNMFTEDTKAAAAARLAELVKANDDCIGTGFPGTPYILFALADNGHADTAFRMLLNTKCPSWLYEVRVGATTIWERWDGLDENGQCPIGDDGTDKMISYNHYASGAVGDFLYRRVLGVEAVEAGYKKFVVKPLIGGGLTHAEGQVNTPYGEVKAAWQLDGQKVTVKVTVPMGTECEVTLPDGMKKTLVSGEHTVSGKIA